MPRGTRERRTEKARLHKPYSPLASLPRGWVIGDGRRFRGFVYQLEGCCSRPRLKAIGVVTFSHSVLFLFLSCCSSLPSCILKLFNYLKSKTCVRCWSKKGSIIFQCFSFNLSFLQTYVHLRSLLLVQPGIYGVAKRSRSSQEKHGRVIQGPCPPDLQSFSSHRGKKMCRSYMAISWKKAAQKMNKND